MANENQQGINPSVISGDATKGIIKNLSALNEMIDILSSNYKAALDQIEALKKELEELKVKQPT